MVDFDICVGSGVVSAFVFFFFLDFAFVIGVDDVHTSNVDWELIVSYGLAKCVIVVNGSY